MVSLVLQKMFMVFLALVGKFMVFLALVGRLWYPLHLQESYGISCTFRKVYGNPCICLPLQESYGIPCTCSKVIVSLALLGKYMVTLAFVGLDMVSLMLGRNLWYPLLSQLAKIIDLEKVHSKHKSLEMKPQYIVIQQEENLWEISLLMFQKFYGNISSLIVYRGWGSKGMTSQNSCPCCLTIYDNV